MKSESPSPSTSSSQSVPAGPPAKVAVSLDYGRRPRTPSMKVIVAGVILGLVIVIGVRSWATRSGPSSAVVPDSRSPSRQELDDLQAKVERIERWQSRIEPRLLVSDEASRNEIDKNIKLLVDFVAERKKGSTEFAKAILSLKGKWRLVRSKLPGWLPRWMAGDPEAHAQFLQEQFSRHVFSPEDFQKTIENVVTGYLDSVAAIENELLVMVRADLANLPGSQPGPFHSDEVFRQEFQQLVEELIPQIASELKIDLGRELAAGVAAKIAVEVMISVGTRLGVSSGLLAAGTLGSVATFGLSLVAAIVIDIAADWLLRLVYDPEKAVADKVNAFLDQMLATLVNGYETNQGEKSVHVPGLREKLAELDRLRAKVRADALRGLVVGKSEASHVP